MPGLPQQDPDRILATMVTFVIAITVHEFMHAWTAWRLGDDTARDLGRISLTPAVHFDPFGFLGFVLIALGFPAFAWGKPVPVNPNRFRGGLRNRRVGMGLVAFAGPLSNVVMAATAAIPLRVARAGEADLGGGEFFLTIFVWVNIGLAAFNMIPVPPLDGSRILAGILPNFWYPYLVRLERYGFAVLLVLIFVGGRAGASVVRAMTDPVFTLLARIVVGREGVF